MNEKPKSGKEIVEEFFSEVGNIDGVDKNVLDILVNLYRDGKLTNTNLTNELTRIQEKHLHED